jgi:cytochrome c-type biogenesis protein CcmE
MESTKVKIGIVTAIIVGSLAWLAVVGMNESKTYYYTVRELKEMGDRVHDRRLRVGGQVVPGSIRRTGRRVEFMLEQGGDTLPVTYVGTDPLPDTFKDEAEALVDGRLGPDGVFQAHKLQAKCASKYEAEGGYKKAGT